MLNRRQFLQVGVAAGAGYLAATRLGFLGRAVAAQSPQVPLAGSVIPKFVDPLPSLEAIVAGTGQIELQMSEFQAQVLPTGMPPTWVWGYLKPGQTSRALSGTGDRRHPRSAN